MTPIKIIAEIGINHNGSVQLAKDLIDIATLAGCDYVKFQKRDPDICVPDSQKEKRRDTPWGEMSYLDYKKKIEFEDAEYIEISKYCQSKNIQWFASVWDIPSCHFMSKYANTAKIPSALITDLELCKTAREIFQTLIISTGMSTQEEIDKCIEVCNPDVIMHTNSTYPSPLPELNLNYIHTLSSQNPSKDIGYSGHEYGLVTTFATVPMGVTWIERHITLDRTMWGSDHLASLEPQGITKLVKGIRDIERALGPINSERVLYPSELSKRSSLRK